MLTVCLEKAVNSQTLELSFSEFSLKQKSLFIFSFEMKHHVPNVQKKKDAPAQTGLFL